MAEPDSTTITIVDYGMGNIGSLVNMFRRIGAQSEVSSDPCAIERACKIVMPGVGAFGAAMERIDALGLRDVLRAKALDEQVPFLGICLGMQLMTRSSEESPGAEGLNLIPADTMSFPRTLGQKVPHMGWNIATPKSDCYLTDGLSDETRFYFVHSYFVRIDDPAHSMMKTNYGIEFESGIACGNVYGVQFHPEKSHRYGMKLLQKFVEL